MPQSLYDARERYTPEASALDGEASRLLRPLIERYQQQGYAVREIAALLQRVIFDLECEAVLQRPRTIQ